MPKPHLLQKVRQTREAIDSCFFHDDYYKRLPVAGLVAMCNGLLEGAQGTGKTHLCRAILKTIDPAVTASQQGYLSADFEQVIAAPDIAKLTQGLEQVKWRKIVTARVKFFDEIQRLGPSALSALFRLCTEGTAEYLDQQEGVTEFCILATANPTETADDTLNVAIPAPLWDRFTYVMWTPLARFHDQARINGNVETAYKAIPVIWTEKDLLELWDDCSKVTIDPATEYVMSLLIRITSFCVKAQGYDASSLQDKKRTICGKCNQNYLCSKVLKPPSIRTKLAFERLARGFAYIDGRDSVKMKDVQDAFAPVFWKRLTFMDEEEISDRLKALQEFYKLLETEIKECHEAIDLVVELKQQYDSGKMQELEEFANSKVWMIEAVNSVKEYHKELKSQLAKKKADAQASNDTKALKDISTLARRLLPPHDAQELFFKDIETLTLNPKTIAQLATVDSNIFQRAKKAYEAGDRRIELSEAETERYREATGKA